MIRIVAATRWDQEGFQTQAMLARTMAKFANRGDMFFMLHQCLPPGGLPDAYNASLQSADPADIIVFTHDDVWIDDIFLPERLTEGLGIFDVIGIAGNRRRVPRQPAWAFPDVNFQWDARENLSGGVTHLIQQREKFDFFGPTPASVVMLDGVFLAARVQTLRAAEVAFDPQFKFNFYDLDFCRSCERAGLRMGTWPIAITHGSGGRFGTPEWQAAYQTYLAKWSE